MPAPCTRFQFTASFSRFSALLLVLQALLTSVAHAQQPVRIGSVVPVGASAPTQPVPVTFAHGGTLAATRVTTQGSTGFDFAGVDGGTCAVGLTYLPGQSCTVNVAFQPIYPGERRGAVVLLDGSNATLALQMISGSASGPVGTFVPGSISTVAGDEAWIFAGDGAPATQTAIFLPFGLAVNAAGDLFFADSSNSRIRVVSAASGLVSTIAGNGIIGATGDNGPATSATISNPSSVVLDAAGNLFFADSGNNVVRRIDAFTGIISTVAGSIGHHGYTGDALLATAATLNTPNGLAFDAAGNLYITDTGNHAIRVVNALTGVISTIAGRGYAGFSGDGGPASAAVLDAPWSVTLAPAGELYIADQNNQRIREIDLSGNISTVAGSSNAGFSGDGALASAAQLNVPASVAIDVAGNLYIADSGNNRIRKVSSKTGIISTIAGNSGESISGDYGPADQAGLYGPYTLALDGQDNLFIADVFHNRIRKIAANAATLEFPAIRVGRVSTPLTQTLENDGNAPLTLKNLLAVTNTQVDSSTTVCAASTPLAPLDTCVIGVDFAPTVTGNPVVGTVNVVSNAGNSPGVISAMGQVLDIDPTTLILASSLNPAVTGASVSFSVNASSAGTTPSGSVTFLDGTTALATLNLAGGAALYTTAALTGGQHSITVSYAGDSSNAAAVSPPLLEVIKDAQPATSTTLTSSASPIDAGASLLLTASVALKSAGSGSTNISGTVTFSEGSTLLGTASIHASTASMNSGSATLSLSTLAVGTHTLAASYAGTASDAASTSAPITQVIQIASTRTALSSSANPSNAGASLTLSATVLSTGGTATGLVNFLDSGVSLGTAPLNVQGVATLTIAGHSWTPATHLLTATYNGDAADSPSTSPILSQQVNPASAAVALSSSLNPAGLGAQVTLSALAHSNGATPTGTLQFYDGAVPLGSATLSSSGGASITLSSLVLGAHPITAVYAGDTYNNASTSPALTQTIQQATIAVSLASSRNPALFGDSVLFAAKVSGSGSNPVGSVSFDDGAVSLASVTLDASGNASVALSTLVIGTHSLTAVYSGDANHAAATSAAVSQVILQSTSTVLTSSAPQTIASLPLTFKASVTGANARPVTGTVTFTDGTSTLGAIAPDANGLATFTATLPVGQHSLKATYSGDSTDAPSASSSVPALVVIAATSTTLASSANPAAAGTPVTFTAAVSGNGSVPTGNVTFSDGATTLSSVPVSATGVASLTLSTLAPGIHPIAATYAGDTNDSPSSSPALSQQIALKSTLSLTSSANPSLLSDNVNLTLTAANGSSTPPTGTVLLTDGGATLATLQLVNGSAAYTLTAPALGSHTLAAVYSGDKENGPASALPMLQTVSLRPTNTALTASSTALSSGQQLILIAVVQPSPTAPRPATGSIAFQSGSQSLGSATLNASGIATLTVDPSQAAYNLVAAYSGDALYAASTSQAIAITVGPPIEFTLTAAPSTLTVQSGQHASLQVAIASNPAFADTLALGCAGLPASATCTFSVDEVTVAGGQPQTLTVTVDTGNPLGAGASARVAPASVSGLFACCLPAGALFTLLLRRRKRFARLTLLASLLLLGVAAETLTGCAGGFTQSATPPGSYTFQIVGTGARTQATQATGIQLTVTQ